MEDLQIVEHVVRKDPKVIEQCVLSGIPAEDMHKVYCDRRSPLFFLVYSPYTKRSQHGPLVTTTDLATTSVYNKHSCIIDLTWTILNTLSPLTSVLFSMPKNKRSSTSISLTFDDPLTRQRQTIIIQPALKKKEVTGKT